MIYEIYIKDDGEKYLEIGTEVNGKKYALLCERTLKGVTGGIESSLNTIKAIETFGDKALTISKDINMEFMWEQHDYDQEKIKVDYKVVLK